MAPKSWLSPEEYARLSPLERKRLWRERGHERAVEQHDRKYRPRRKRMTYRQRKLRSLLVVVPAFAVAMWAVDQGVRLPEFSASPVAVTAPGAGERVEFGLCVWGGGTDCVVDGDTIYLHRVKIRIAGIDAPETHDFKCPSEKALGDRATLRLQQLLNAGALSLSSIDRDQDVYGRKLRNISVAGSDVGETLVGEGLARWYAGGRRSWCR